MGHDGLVWVTGAQGWLGQATVTALLQAGHTVLGLGRSAQRGRAGAGYAYRTLDLCDQDALARVFAEDPPAAIVHLAGGQHGATPEALDAVNVAPIAALVAARPPETRLVFGGSGAVYGAAPTPQAEEGPTAPLSAYGHAKLRAERIALQAEGEVVSARIFNVVGPGQPASFLPGTLARQLAAIVRGEAPPRLCVGPLWTTRDYIDVRDVARGLVTLATTSAAPPRLVNLCSGVETPVQRVWDLLVALAEKAGCPPLDIERLPEFPQNLPRQAGSTDRSRALGLGATISLERSLTDLFHEALDAAPLERP